MKSPNFFPFLNGLFLVGTMVTGLATIADGQSIADGVDNPTGTVFETNAADRDTDENYPAGEWTYDTTTTFDGTDSVRTTLPDNKFSILDAEVQGPAVLTFRWKASLDDLFDTFGFSAPSTSFTIRPP